MVTVAVICCMTVSAQMEKTLRFIPESMDFGVIREENGKTTRTVKAVNISADTTFIISARTSCGCSEAQYSDKKLAPGDTTEVSVTYDPVNRPGKFQKTAKFFTGEERIGNSLKLNGTVIPSRRNLDKVYPDKAGNLRLTSQIINAGEVSVKEVRPCFVGIYNDSDRVIGLNVTSDSKALDPGLATDSIEPFGITTLTLMIKGREFKKDDSDFLYKAYLIDSESGDTITCIPVGGSIKPAVNN